jgi:hypothetical protein
MCVTFRRFRINEPTRKWRSSGNSKPASYPQAGWDEVEDAIDNLDLPKVALPVYQKYLSESDAGLLIKLFAPPQGQKLAQSILTRDAQAQHAGARMQPEYSQTLQRQAGRDNTGCWQDINRK